MIDWNQLKAAALGATHALLLVTMAQPAGMAQEAMRPPVRAGLPGGVHTAPLTQQERGLHALNRLTFGPRPGDEAAVQTMGLERWFELQLHPERIDDAALDRRLAMFPAMQLSTAELMERFPGPQRIRQMDRQDTPLPADPMQRAIYADSEAAYKQKKQKDAAGANGVVADQVTMAGMDESRSPSGMTKGGLAEGKTKKGGMTQGAMETADVDALLALPAEQRLGRLVAMSPDEMLALRAAVKPRQIPELMAGLTPAQMEAVAAMQAPERVVAAEALESRLMRDVYSQRQLQAVMTDFWLNHFNVYLRKNQIEPYYLPAYQRDTVLPNALGNFEQLLVATAQSPAMLLYLDNWESIGPDSLAATRVRQVQAVRPNGKIAQALPKGINENYARELMELHTLGVGGGYTQADVIAVARCFTGWTIERPYAGAARKAAFSGGGDAQPGTFVFEPNRHEGGDKVVLGHTIHEGGMNEGLQVLHILATSPATAKFISTKLAVRFVSDDPSAALVNAMAATFLKTNGDIKAVLATMFHSPEFFAPQVYRAKVKTPIEFLASALRASDADVKNALPLVQAMDRLGMPIYGMQTPNGYSWKADEWVSSNALIGRMNFALVLSGDKVPGTVTNWPALLGAGTSTTAPTPGTERELETTLLGEPASPRTRSTVLAQFNNPTAQEQAQQSFNARPVSADAEDAMMAGPLRTRAGKNRGAYGGQPETPLDTMAGLLLGSPDFQRR